KAAIETAHESYGYTRSGETAHRPHGLVREGTAPRSAVSTRTRRRDVVAGDGVPRTRRSGKTAENLPGTSRPADPTCSENYTTRTGHFSSGPRMTRTASYRDCRIENVSSPTVIEPT